MARNMFGWSYPPGADTDPNAPWNQEDGPCAVCCKPVDDCVCPECQTRGAQGDPKCYAVRMNPFNGHGLKLSREQVIGRAEALVQVRQEALDDAKQYVDYLKNGGPFSEELDDNPDPYR